MFRQGKQLRFSKVRWSFYKCPFLISLNNISFFKHKIYDYQDLFEEYNNFEVTKKLLFKFIE